MMAMPKCSKIVFFGQYILLPKKKIGHNHKGTTLEPMGDVSRRPLGVLLAPGLLLAEVLQWPLQDFPHFCCLPRLGHLGLPDVALVCVLLCLYPMDDLLLTTRTASGWKPKGSMQLHSICTGFTRVAPS